MAPKSRSSSVQPPSSGSSSVQPPKSRSSSVQAAVQRLSSCSKSVQHEQGATTPKQQEQCNSLKSIPNNEIVLASELANGRFKRVHAGLLNKEPVAVLRFRESQCREVQILSILASHGRNPHIPFVHGSCEKRGILWVLQERAAHGSLKAVLQGDGKLFGSRHMKCAASQIADAMAFLEMQRIVHADLSCRNVLVFRMSQESPEDTLCKVTDFGLSIALPKSKTSEILKQPKAVRWSAPETIVESKFSYKSDAWAIGATMWEMFSGGESPWKGLMKKAEVTQRLTDLASNHELDLALDFPQPDTCDTQVYEVILCCLQSDELRRLDSKDVQRSFMQSSSTEQQHTVKQLVGAVETSDDLISTAAASVSVESSQESPPRNVCAIESSSGDPLDTMLAVLHTKESLLDDKSVQIMLQAIEDARNREAHLVSEVNELNSKLAEANSRQTLPRRWNLPRNLLCCSSTLPSSTAMTMPTSPLVEQVATNVLPQPAPGAWCLYSLGDGCVKRTDIFSHAEAMRAFTSTQSNGPCMLRDPSGTKMMAHLWKTSY